MKKKSKASPQKSKKKAVPVSAKKKRVVRAASPKKSDLRIGIMGGVFSPIHIGHLTSALSVRKAFNLDQVVLIPTCEPPHRKVLGPAAEDRLEMVKMAVRPYEPELIWDDIEIKRQGISYTVETLRAYNKNFKAENIYFIMGADAFLDFPRWKEFEELISLANFVVTTRPGTHLTLDAVDLPLGLDRFVKAADKTRVVLSTKRVIEHLLIEDVNISSTEIRKKLRMGHRVNSLVTPEVLEYIEKKGLYKRTSPLVEDYRDFSFYCSEKALDKKALSLKIYDMTGQNAYADYSIICSATSTRHATAIGEGILHSVKEQYGLAPLSLEGMREGLWVLIDFGSVVIHIFNDAVRGQYKIEELWKECRQIQDERQLRGSLSSQGPRPFETVN